MSTAAMKIITLDSPGAQAHPTAEYATVTPGLAREWLGRNEGNRNLKQLKIAAYVRDILAGKWMVTGEAIKFDWNGRLIDGQNRLHAIIKANKPVVLLVVRGLDPDSQKVLDTGAKRSAADALKMSDHHNNPGVLAAAIRLLIAWDSGVLVDAYSRAPEVTHSEVLDFYAEHDGLDSAVAMSSRWAKAIGATPGPLTACIFLTSAVDADASFRFFQSLAELDLGGKGDPRAALYTRLQSLRNEKHIPAQQVYFIVRAWNAWRGGKRVLGMKDRQKGTPSRIPDIR